MDERDGYFDEAVAATYDESTGPEFDDVVIARTVDLLTELAGGGRALELAVGTGRVALPLSRRGVVVEGIDLSRAMLARLRGRPGGAAVRTYVGDITRTRAGGSFRLVYLVFNTIMNLTTQSAQVACFRNAAAQLEPGGCFLVEVMVPQLRRLPPGQTAVPFDVSAGHLGFDVYDTATQQLSSHHVTVRDGVAGYSTTPFRYVWPSELDLMAELAGLRPRARWAGWSREPFTAESDRHVSVWQKPA